ncbi:capsular biosynthesis protein [Intrasporangium oryzae NRRL B-24470]|uniref:Capsular biosynthesis protein n=1 Tax=Intrasporangium oryzae NRRL B-24470 TaxID=1386089 RepID=W9G9N4_9MICO|nr:polysaccharide biosynthesis tyrosine autokinase [Intrasporangium oryzae]EWT02785.1 capsular biosynthesis protein [Intrasporangium oryzae NRRL B-24470]
MTFREFLSVLRARWRLVAASLLVVLAGTALSTMATTPVYEAVAKVYLSTQKPATAKGDQSDYAVSITRQDLNTFVEVLTSETVLVPLRQRLGLPPGAGVDVSATISELTNVLEIRATSSNPEQAALIANTAGPVLAEAAQQFSPLLANSGQAVESKAISAAVVPGSPKSPNAKRNLALGLLAGLAAGIGLALLRHVSDTKIRGEDDVKKLSDRPILGTLPLVRNTPGSVLSLETAPHSHHAEAIRRLRTNLLFVDVTTQGHSFVVTSSNPGEGKTTTTVNLALAMADAGSRVLLLDGDLRNPSVAKSMGLEGSVGLTTILLGRAEPGDVIQQWRDTSLYVLAAGQIPPNPSELLGSEAMSQLFQKLSQDFDFILVDSPPINPVIDAVLLNRLTRGLVMVVAADRTRRKDLENALHALDTVDVAVSGFALNLATGGADSSYKYGTYGYGQTAALHTQPVSRRGTRKSSIRLGRKSA